MMQGIYRRGSLHWREAKHPSIFPCTCLALVLSSIDGCEVLMSAPGVEDDYAAAEIAVETRAFGIISDDSDFLCFQVTLRMPCTHAEFSHADVNVGSLSSGTAGWREGVLRTRRQHIRSARVRSSGPGPVPWHSAR